MLAREDGTFAIQPYDDDDVATLTKDVDPRRYVVNRSANRCRYPEKLAAVLGKGKAIGGQGFVSRRFSPA
jgi:hypothetical protein